MLGLTPNIYALKYLYAQTGKYQNVKLLITNARSNIQFGYQNELNYMHDDGSFSAFGKSDKNGSSWLTAFVIKSFSQAKQYVETIDESVIKKSINWLISNINEDGSFSEPGTIIHRDMQGGVNSKLTSTSYILASLLESNIFDFLNQKILNSIAKSTKFLEKHFESIQNDTYSLSLITYALNLGNSNLGDKSFFLLNSLAKKHNDDELYWSSSSLKTEESTETASSDIEMTSYALLTYLLRGEISKSLAIVKWLISKSNSLGAYSSTQNTILALQSLSQFGLSIMTANESYTYNIDINITAENSFNQTLVRSFNVNDKNSFILQTWNLPDCNYNLSVNANGNGFASLQVISKYNLKSVAEQEAFSLEQKVLFSNESINKVHVQTCVQYHDISDNQTGMSIIEASLFSGFEVNKADMDKIVLDNYVNSELKMIEILKDNKVAFYMQKLDMKKICFNWTMTRSYFVRAFIFFC